MAILTLKISEVKTAKIRVAIFGAGCFSGLRDHMKKLPPAGPSGYDEPQEANKYKKRR
jgi:hypothetical protein